MKSSCSPTTSTSVPPPSPTSTKNAGKSNSSSKPSRSKVSWALAKTPYAFRFGQPSSPYSCSNGSTTSPAPGWSFSNLAYLLRLNLFTYRDLRQWLNAPYNTPPQIPPEEQLQLLLTGFGQATRRTKKKKTGLTLKN